MKKISYRNKAFVLTALSALLVASASSALADDAGIQLGTAVTETEAQTQTQLLNQTQTEAESGAPINASDFAPCTQEMTTCPCNGVRVEKDVVKSGDVLMLRLKDTSVVSFPLRVE